MGSVWNKLRVDLGAGSASSGRVSFNSGQAGLGDTGSGWGINGSGPDNKSAGNFDGVEPGSSILSTPISHADLIEAVRF